MSGDAVARLLEGADRLFGFTSDCEITLEANPGTVDEGRFRAFRDAGVNRVSVGVQSFMNEKLRKLGRIHVSEEALRAAAHAGEVFGNFNLDLMFALPGETLEEVAREVETAVATGATHLSFYQLTIEPGTAFAKRVPEDLPDDDLCADMSDLVIRSLEEAGFEHYEVSGYAGPGCRCRHNLNYWDLRRLSRCGSGRAWKGYDTGRSCSRGAGTHPPASTWLRFLKREAALPNAGRSSLGTFPSNSCSTP